MRPRRLAFRAGARIVVASVAAELAERAARLYPDYAVQPGSHPAAIHLSASGEGGFRLQAPGRDEVAPGAAYALGLLELTLAEMLLQDLVPLLPLHGAGIRGAGGAVVVAGPAEAGKSTLTVGLARRGYGVYGDDIVLLDPDICRLRPFKRLLKLAGPPLERLALRPGQGPFEDLVPDASLFHPADLGTRWAEPAPVVAVVFPVGARSREPGLHPLGGGEAMVRLLGEILFRDAAAAPEFATLAACLADARFYELALSDLTAALDALEGLLGQRAGGSAAH